MYITSKSVILDGLIWKDFDAILHPHVKGLSLYSWLSVYKFRGRGQQIHYKIRNDKKKNIKDTFKVTHRRNDRLSVLRDESFSVDVWWFPLAFDSATLVDKRQDDLFNSAQFHII